MWGLYYQLKSVCRDKFCILSFLMPVVVAFFLQFIGSIDFSAVGELHFAVIENTVPEDTVLWLERYGTVTECADWEQLVDAVNEPSTTLIGVEMDGKGIKTIISGDELEIFRETADTLPELYAIRGEYADIPVQKRTQPDVMENYQNLFMILTLIVAMFMGCTFNAVNMISEKEDGVAFINEILPMTRIQYALQKTAVGFVFGFLSAALTALIGIHLPAMEIAVLVILMNLSSFVASIFGLLIGKLSEGLMVGIVYIKVLMILFMAVPMFAYLMDVKGFLAVICNVVPSTATFRGVMELLSGNRNVAISSIWILCIHLAGWFLVWLILEKKWQKYLSV